MQNNKLLKAVENFVKASDELREDNFEWRDTESKDYKNYEAAYDKLREVFNEIKES